MTERLVVIGGDAAGMGAASQARRLRPDLEIVALEKGRWTSYSACGIPYLVAGEVESLDDLVTRTPQEFRERQRIDVRTGHEVLGIDIDRRQVEVRDHDHDRSYRLAFDQLMIGTGARPRRPDLPGIDLDHVVGVQTLDDADHLTALMEGRRCRRVVVVGAGYIGLEMAEAFTRRELAVTVVEAGPEVMGTLDPELGALVSAAMGRHGIDVRVSTSVTGFTPDVVQTDGGDIEADLVVLGLGVTPNVELADDAGVVIGRSGAIQVDRRQATSVEGVWAAGDCAESYHRVLERPVHIALGTVANRQARVAGLNIGGGYASFPGVVGTAVSKLCSTEVARTGLTEAQAVAAGFGVVSATIESTTRAGYYPGAKPITVKLVAERGSGRLLGGQIVGEEGAAKRIDVLATAIWTGLTVDALIDVDLSYAPPFSPVWDPVATAARQAAKQV